MTAGTGRRRAGLALALSLLLAAPLASSAAQEVSPPALQLSVGSMHYELATPRDGAIIAVRLVSPIVPLGRRHFLVEPGLAYAWYRIDDGTRRHVAIPEIGMQFQAGPSGIQPFVGVAGGLMINRADSMHITKLTASASVGLRLYVPGGWGVAGELRLRTSDFFKGHSRELLFSLVRQLE